MERVGAAGWKTKRGSEGGRTRDDGTSPGNELKPSPRAIHRAVYWIAPCPEAQEAGKVPPELPGERDEQGSTAPKTGRSTDRMALADSFWRKAVAYSWLPLSGQFQQGDADSSRGPMGCVQQLVGSPSSSEMMVSPCQSHPHAKLFHSRGRCTGSRPVCCVVVTWLGRRGGITCQILSLVGAEEGPRVPARL